MNRASMGILSQWLVETNRQPLVLRGARQVGKTWLVRELAKLHGLRLVEINFERAGSEVTGIFRAKDPRAVLRGLELMTGHGIDPGSTLFKTTRPHSGAADPGRPYSSTSLALRPYGTQSKRDPFPGTLTTRTAGSTAVPAVMADGRPRLSFLTCLTCGNAIP